MESKIPTELLAGCVVAVGGQLLFVQDAHGVMPRGVIEVTLHPDGSYANKGQRRSFYGDGDETAESIALEYFREFKRTVCDHRDAVAEGKRNWECPVCHISVA